MLPYHSSASPTTAGKHLSCLSYLSAENKDGKAKSRDLTVSQIRAAHAGLSQLRENTSQPRADGSNSQLVPELAAHTEGHTATIPNIVLEPGSGKEPVGTEFIILSR